MAQKTYFVMPNYDYEPNHSIKLGQIITLPKKPWEQVADPLDIPETKIQHNLKTDWGSEVQKTRENSVGVWTSFLAAIFGVGGDVIVTWSHENSQVFEFSELETTFFEPDQKYVEASILERPAVTDWIKANPRKSMYMITGLKIARGARYLRTISRGVDVEAKVGVDATPFAGVPVSGGPLAGTGRSTQDSTWFGNSSDFVFAYRLRRIIVKRRATTTKEFVHGATVVHLDRASGAFPPEEPVSSDVDQKRANEEIQSIDLALKDYGSGGYDLDGFTAIEVRDEENDDSCLVQIDHLSAT